MVEKTDKSLRLLLMVSEDAVNRCSDFISHLLVGLHAEQCRCAVITPPGRAEDFVSGLPVEVIRYPLVNTVLMKKYNRERLLNTVEAFKPNLIHNLCESNASVVRFLVENLNLPYIQSYYTKPHWFHGGRLSKDHCFRILSASSKISHDLQKKHPFLKDRIGKVDVGTFIDDTTACFSEGGRVPSIIISHPIKKLTDFSPVLSAARHLGIDGYEFMMAIIGSGSSEMALRKQVHNMGLSNHINVVGEINPIRKFLAGADIYLQPCPVQDFNYVLYEAMGVGVAIASPQPEEKLLEDGKTAFIFDHSDELSVYSVLKNMLDQRDEARRVAKNAQERLREHNTASRMIERMMGLYRQAGEWGKESLPQQ